MVGFEWTAAKCGPTPVIHTHTHLLPEHRIQNPLTLSTSVVAPPMCTPVTDWVHSRWFEDSTSFYHAVRRFFWFLFFEMLSLEM